MISLSECIDGIRSLNTESDIPSLQLISDDFEVKLKALKRIKGQFELPFQSKEDRNEGKRYEITLTFQDLNSDCVDAVFKQLTMREKFAVERVSNSWQEDVKRALKQQSELIIVSNNQVPYRPQPRVEFRYNKTAAAKVFRKLSNVKELKLVGFELNIERFAIVKKFPKLTSLTLTQCQVTNDENSFYGLADIVKKIEYFELTQTLLDRNFFAEFLEEAMQLKKVKIHSMPFRFDQWGVFLKQAFIALKLDF